MILTNGQFSFLNEVHCITICKKWVKQTALVEMTLQILKLVEVLNDFTIKKGLYFFLGLRLWKAICLFNSRHQFLYAADLCISTSSTARLQTGDNFPDILEVYLCCFSANSIVYYCKNPISRILLTQTSDLQHAYITLVGRFFLLLTAVSTICHWPKGDQYSFARNCKLLYLKMFWTVFSTKNLICLVLEPVTCLGYVSRLANKELHKM